MAEDPQNAQAPVSAQEPDPQEEELQEEELQEGESQESEAQEQGVMPLVEHLKELRKRLLISVCAFAVSSAAAYVFADGIYGFLSAPLRDLMGEDGRMIYTALTEVFFTHLKVALFGGLVIAFPVIASQMWFFIAPGLYQNERRAFLPFLLASPALFILGTAVAYYLVIPLAWRFFLSFEGPSTMGGLPIELEAKVGEYLGLVMKLIIAFGLSFQVPVALMLLVKAGLLSCRALKRYRKYAIVIAFVMAAVLTPPDLISQVMLATPIILLYELSVILAFLVERKRREEK
ncbi:MAG: twin-arginine translocase subunit TatC [Pseudomonadota bacterium]